ncbi:hypothetical protein EV586_104403 [Tumebacillus sp. BK434]|nr:hypothetical protein EV586_104403 [Tumebacillus sp. BK434]
MEKLFDLDVQIEQVINDAIMPGETQDTCAYVCYPDLTLA